MKFALGLVLAVVAVAVSTAAIDDECSLKCQDVHKPVCGSNNETYYNECLLRLESCLTDDEVVKVSDGECAATPAITAPPSLNALGNIDDDECGVACWMSDEPVIDEDGVEYQNECFMNAAKCESKRNKNKKNNNSSSNNNNQSEDVGDFILHA